ncbi:UNKNOWN [Stylonychia lemnae]|uniref:Uncharacterized protein n=1 Tax=Stylonychia lemnae TaxID=5949 RepID=A0A078A3H6_STYLE|nr:UNKNOWN [Stylonychia lemnae]|eukprot:CDW76833.1 UNKNOWN [Stylonychia lemnae]
MEGSIGAAVVSRKVSRDQEKKELTKKQLKKLKVDINPHEWTKQLDLFLLDSVIRNYFNFDQVSLELNDQAKRLHLYFGATHSFTNQKCRIRWSYLHMKLPFRINVEQKALEDRDKILDLNQNKKAHEQLQEIRLQQQNLQQQNLESQRQEEEQKRIEQAKKQAEIERRNLWKKHVIFRARQKKDVLDITNEDFSKNKSFAEDGRIITPSNFNIFRDSLRQASEKLEKTLIENLPEANLRQLEQDEESEYENEDNDNEEILPLDFRTAMIESENKVVIQAKPLHFKTDEEILREFELEARMKKKNKFLNDDNMDTYLDSVKKEPFKDENVILIDPEINIKEKFDQIDLLCNKENRINNTLNAPIKTQEQIIREQLLMQQLKAQSKAPLSSKQYDTDTDGEEEFMKKQRNQTSGKYNQTGNIRSNSNVDPSKILKQWGVSDLNSLIPGVSSASESESEQKRKKPQPKSNPKNKSAIDKDISIQIQKYPQVDSQQLEKDLIKLNNIEFQAELV